MRVPRAPDDVRLIHIKVIVSSQSGGQREAVGLTSGKLMAMSTYGSIAGTLLATFVLIPYLGIRSTLALFSVSTLLLVAGGVLLFSAMSRGRLALLGLGAASLAFFLTEEHKADNLVAETESTYGTIQVLRAVDEEGDESRIFKPSRVYSHSEVFLDKPLKDQMGLAYLGPGLVFGARSYLVLGVAGGDALLQLKTLAPGASVTGVELDPEALRIAREHFKMPTGEGVTLAVEDARVYLRSTQQKFDYIIVDLFSGDHLPAHCVSQEFFSLVKRRLAPGGIMFVNTNMVEVHAATRLSIPVDAPLPHLHSAILNAGFASVFQNDLFNAGFLYAFTEPLSHAAFQERLRAASQDEQLDVNLRASLAATALLSVPVPAERRQVRPFTD
ncbi:MAG TPA: fused MFS/spermidine synthase [Hyalangium sp.]|nr:fused MFS/spermidine synthase [Hyalangium sp.]